MHGGAVAAPCFRHRSPQPGSDHQVTARLQIYAFPAPLTRGLTGKERGEPVEGGAAGRKGD